MFNRILEGYVFKFKGLYTNCQNYIYWYPSQWRNYFRSKISRELQLPFDSASNVIKKMTEQNWDDEKRVRDIDSNQNCWLLFFTDDDN